MTHMNPANSNMPGPRAPAFFYAALLTLAALGSPAHAQQAAQPQPVPQAQQARPPISSQPVPSELELAKLIWSTMAMVDHANRSGNYSVLRDTSASGFQIQNDPSRLAEIFSTMRQMRVDLGNTLIVAPTYTAAPVLLQADVFEVKGYFGLRPTPIFFDLYFKWEQGRWKLFGVSITPGSMTAPGQAPQVQPQPAPVVPKRR